MFVVERRVYERIRGRLRRLYGEDALDALMERLQLIVGRYGVGAECPPAEVASSSEQSPYSWTWKPCRPGSRLYTSATTSTPSDVSVKVTVP